MKKDRTDIRARRAQLTKKLNSKSRAKLRSSSLLSLGAPCGPAIVIRPRVTVNAPECLDLSKNHVQVLDFFNEVRYEASRTDADRTLVIDFAPIKELELSSSLVLVAELHRWQIMQKVSLTPDTIGTWTPEVVRRLVMLGFFKLLKSDVPKMLLPPASDMWIPYTSGVQTIGLAARRLRQRLENRLGKSTGMHAEIYASLVEAMKNAFQHAYPDDCTAIANLGRRWWMTGKVDLKENIIQLAFLDQGITIPRSLQSSWMWPELRDEIGEQEDTDAIRIVKAMQYGVTRLTGQTHRGKGFRDIQYPVLLDPRNRLRIISGKGHYTGYNDLFLAANATTFFKGTLIDWHLHLPETMIA